MKDRTGKFREIIDKCKKFFLFFLFFFLYTGFMTSCSARFRILTYLFRYPLLAIGTIFCATLSTAMVAPFPIVTERIIDLVLKQGHTDQLLFFLALGFIASLLQNLFNSLRIFLNNHFEQRVIFDLRSDVYYHIQRLPLAWFDRHTTGDIMTRLMEDVTSLERSLIDGIEQGSVALLQIFIVVVVMFYYNASLALTALSPLPFLILGTLLFSYTAQGRYKKERSAASSLNAILHDNIDGIRQIKTYTSEVHEHHRFNDASNKVRLAMLRIMKAWALYNPSISFLNAIGMLLILAYGTYQILRHQLELGVLIAFLVLVRYLYEPIDRLNLLSHLFQSGRAASKRLFTLLDEKPEPGYLSTCQAPASPLSGAVSFQDVSFSYTADTPVLQHLSFEVKPGEMIALVGPTGSGKSTLVNLLSRFYEVSQGEILLDKYPLHQLPLDFLRRSIGVVTQESFLFNGTTADNLRIARADVSEEEMWQVLQAANAAPFVSRLPQGLHTPLGERGIKLSVGEKQRLSIARALLKNPPILILDEATASVDNTTERLIQEALQRLLVGRTSFVIAHRLSTIRHASQILVLKQGQIVERGPHDVLLEKKGLYSQLYQEMLHLS